MRRLISVIVPVYNEEANIPGLHSRLDKVLRGLSHKVDYEIIFVNDGSQDAGGRIISELAASDSRIGHIEFARNFGKEIATTAGLHHAKGDAAVMMDADLQHPPEIIPDFVNKWIDGADMVIGIRSATQGAGIVRMACSAAFYFLMNRIGEIEIRPNATDFRLLDRRVINEFNRFTEKNRMTRGLLDWLGFRKDYVTFVAPHRKHGHSSYGTIRRARLATSAIVANSLFPLRLAGYLGILITGLSGMGGLFVFFEKYVFGDPFGLSFSGPAQLAIILLFLIGIVLICLGLIALYIANIHGEVMNRPLYVIRRKENIHE